jgi:hypothetical protein
LGVAHLSAVDAEPDAQAWVNPDGQVAGTINGMPFLWTPSAPNGATGVMLNLGPQIAAQIATLPGQKQSAGAPSLSRVIIAGLNSYGQVAGETAQVKKEFSEHGAYLIITEDCRASFLWTPSAANGAQGRVTVFSGTCSVAGLNDWGQVALNTGRVVAQVWTPTTAHSATGAFTTLPDVDGGNMQLDGINADGQIIGDSTPSNAIDTTPGFLWTPTTPHGSQGTVTLLRPSGVNSLWALNDDGQVLGQTMTGPDMGYNAWLWTPQTPNATQGTFTTLDALPLDQEGDFGQLSSSGAVIGTSDGSCIFILCLRGDSAVMWRPTTPNSAVGRLEVIGGPTEGRFISPEAINGRSEVLENSCTVLPESAVGCITPQQRLFVWDPVHGLHEVQDLLDTQAGRQFTLKWYGLALNDAGEIATCGQDSAGHNHLLLLTPYAA